ncbi:TlpA family protein disulfide reductase [Paucidesulfovibrio longus]|uniref:TlpA family protein disulfide reductase n=1 Tax=Paucidesulfovibrio longus TaxID=889 RepID=UPI0003B655FA|nr:TlpA disulfide reductase family protein [Paucidesulfovibrio longus]
MTLRISSTLLLALLIALPLGVPAHAQNTSGDALFPDLLLSGRLAPGQLDYLGVSSTPLRLSDIKAEFLFVEIFSMYCPYCQRDAPGVNKLYERARKSGLADRLRFVGVGTGNTQYEVGFYAEKFATPFPLLPDEDYALHEALGNVGTPYFLLLRNAGRDRLEVVSAHEGSPESLEKMFDEMLQKGGLE